MHVNSCIYMRRTQTKLNEVKEEMKSFEENIIQIFHVTGDERGWEMHEMK